jgi:hypothetical protein
MMMMNNYRTFQGKSIDEINEIIKDYPLTWSIEKILFHHKMVEDGAIRYVFRHNWSNSYTRPVGIYNVMLGGYVYPRSQSPKIYKSEVIKL